MLVKQKQTFSCLVSFFIKGFCSIIHSKLWWHYVSFNFAKFFSTLIKHFFFNSPTSLLSMASPFRCLIDKILLSVHSRFYYDMWGKVKSKVREPFYSACIDMLECNWSLYINVHQHLFGNVLYSTNNSKLVLQIAFFIALEVSANSIITVLLFVVCIISAAVK